MVLDPQTIGTHAGTGMLGTFLTYLGFRERLKRQEDRIDALESKALYKDVHGECSQSWHTQLGQLTQAVANMNKKIDALLLQLSQDRRP